MPEDTRVREGRCRCGDVRFRLAGPPRITMACHCRGCQRMTGGPYSISAVFPVERFTVIAGQTIIGGIGEPPMHHHCPSCFSWVFTRMDGWPFVNVRTSMLDDPTDLAPFVETQVADRLPFATTGALRSFERFPAYEEWPGLMEAYSKVSADRAT